MTEIWIITEDQKKYDFFEMHYNLRYFSTYQSAVNYILCPDIARPDFIFFDMKVGSIDFFSFHANEQLEDELRLLNFCVIMPYDDIDLARKGYALGASIVAVEPLRPSASRAFIESKLLGDAGRDYNIDNRFRGRGVEFTPTEEQILYVLSRMKDNRSRAETVKKFCWGDQVRQEKTMEMHISNVRKKIEKFGYTISKSDQYYYLHKIGLGPKAGLRPVSMDC